MILYGTVQGVNKRGNYMYIGGWGGYMELSAPSAQFFYKPKAVQIQSIN